MPVMTDHLYSFAEWCELPEDERLKIEVVEGVRTVSPRGYTFHQRAVHRLVERLERELPVELSPLAEVDVVLATSPLTVRIPDVVVVDSAVVAANPPRVRGGDVRLAVEVLSDGTRRVDRVMKFAEYAEAGIPQYWIVDLDPPITLRAFSLVNGAYEADGEFSRAQVLLVAGHPVGLDPAGLTAR
ncbi:Uma2 family endonuclease [Tsukamurella spumae]|uniref:Uma2 family endonuclease n=1 Tax=Tsukamurella spumae TaxID=44753 RepID=A0A846X5G0_9ACTN|nr:Uma2 family endonuclease [Tsukamurella spumae]NKY19549.1 Uma2 family endonuclease [Tsukamurella spumae]